MKIDLRIDGLERVRDQILSLAGAKLEAAAAAALNDVAFEVRKRYQQELRTVFDRPTPYTVSSPTVVKAEPGNLTALIAPLAKGKGTDPEKFLLHHIKGGQRRLKRSEAALRRIGILPPGYFTAIPTQPYPGSHDNRGNFRGAFITQLLSYFRAFGEQGYRANMTDRRRKNLAKIGKTAGGYKSIGGVVYFTSYGRMRDQHLAPGIWAKSGIHGAVVKPVMIFVRTPSYSRRLDLDRIIRQSNVQQTFERRLRYRIRVAAGT